MGRLKLYLIVGLVLGSLSGCQSIPWKREPMPPVELLDETKTEMKLDTKTEPVKTEAPAVPAALQMSTKQRIKDVPLPAKAKEDLERTYLYESPSLQLGRMVYTIYASVNEVAQFYIDNMPAAGWKRVDIKQAEGGVELLFRKEGRKLDVAVIPLGVTRGKRLVIHLVPDEETGTNP